MANFKEHTPEQGAGFIELTEVFNTYTVQDSGGEYGSYRQKSGEYTRPHILDARDIALVEDRFLRDEKHTPYDTTTRVILVSGDVFYATETKEEIKQKRAAALKL